MAEQKLKWPLTKVIEVSWWDANARSAWGSREEYMHHDIAPCLTVGYLLKQTKKSVTVVMTQGADFDDVNQAISIPMNWVEKIKVLRK